MKKKAVSFLLPMMLMCLVGCSPYAQPDDPWPVKKATRSYQQNENGVVYWEMETGDGKQGYVYNGSDDTIIFGYDAYYQVYRNGEWCDIEADIADVPAAENRIESKHAKRARLYPGREYGELPEGTYRMLVECRFESTSAEPDKSFYIVYEREVP